MAMTLMHSILDLASGTKLYRSMHCKEYFHVTDWPNLAPIMFVTLFAIVVVSLLFFLPASGLLYRSKIFH